jgi:L-ascorbate metabolism protein UlaG (beta-lactamase superfamily)
VGYIIEIGGIRYAVCGDTDATEELTRIKCDVLFIPIGGTYTMTAREAADCANKINPQTAVPVHYNGIVGGKGDENIFIKNINKGIVRRTFL